MSPNPEARKVLNEYLNVVWTLFGTFHDASHGFRRGYAEKVALQASMVKEFAKTEPEIASIEYLDQRLDAYGTGPPDDPASIVHYASTQGEYKNRNAEGGINDVFLGNMTLLAIYQYWEDEYRGKLANALSKKHNDVKADIFGDIRLIRNSIVHHGGICQPEIGKCRVLKWFVPGDRILVNDMRLKEIFEGVRAIPDLLGF